MLGGIDKWLICDRELRVVLNIHASETVQNVLHDFDAFLYENLIIESYRFVEDTAGMERLGEARLNGV